MTWTYQHLLNAALQAALTLGLSYSVGLQIQTQTPTILKGLSLFLNRICIPVMSFWAVGIKLDLTYEGHWKFVAAFLIQTLLFTMVITMWVFVPWRGRGEGKGRGKAEVWTEKFGAELVTSSAILGPLALEGALGKEFVPLAFLTAFNTIAVQFPLLQIMLEKSAQFNDEESAPIIPQTSPQKPRNNFEKWDSAKINETEQKIENRRKSLGQSPRFDSANNNELNAQNPWKRNSLELTSLNVQTEIQKYDQNSASNTEISIDLENFTEQKNEAPVLTIEHRSLAHNKKEKNNQIFPFIKEILTMLIQNPMIWAIIAGILVSVTGLREFLDPESPNFVLEISWIESAFRALGACLTPIALVVTGLWISKNKIFKSCNIYMITLDLFFKFIIIPVSMIPIAMILGLRGDEAKASVILSAMPMALVVVPLAQQYNVAVNDFTVNLVLGLILMFPCILALMEFMNSYGLFNVV